MDYENNTQINVPLQKKPPTPVGALIGSIIIIMILVLCGLYLWSTNIEPKIQGTDNPTLSPEEQALINAEAKLEVTDIKINQLESQGTTDDVASIEQDLNAVGMDDLDSEIEGI